MARACRLVHRVARAVIGSGLIVLATLAIAAPAYALTRQAEPQLFTIGLPLVVDGHRFATIPFETTIDTLNRVSPPDVARALAAVINAQTQAGLLALGPDLRPASELEALGLTLRLDPRTLSVTVDISLPSRAGLEASLSRDWVTWDETAIEPDVFAFGMTGALAIADTLSESTGTTADLSLDGFLNIGGGAGVSLDWGGRASLRSSGNTGFDRDRIIAYADNAGTARRISAGDLAPQLARNIGIIDLAGLSFETNYRELQPTRNIRPTGDRSLVLERPSSVEVYVNGALIDRFNAGPGPVDLRDIPLANTSNDVVIVVEDEFGRREADRFTLSANVTLLTPGLSEMVWAAGFARDGAREGFAYNWNRPVMGGQWTRGLSATLTLGASRAVTPDYHGASGTAAFPLLGGIAQSELTLSRSDATGSGRSVGLAFSGGPYWDDSHRTTLNLRLDYFSAEFATLNDLGSADETRLNFGGDLRINISEGTAMSLGAQIRQAHGADDLSTTLSAGLNRRFGEILISGAARHTEFGSGNGENSFFVTISRRFGIRHFTSASYDSLSRSSRLDWRRSRSAGLPNLQARASAVRRPLATEWNGGIGLENDRAGLVINADHRAARDGSADRTGLSVRLQSGIAYAGGRLGIGRDPGRGFVMVDRHASLGDADISVATGSSTDPVAHANRRGPAIISVDAPYRPLDIRIDAHGLEPGYDIGPGQYTLIPAALTGTFLRVGTDAFRTAIGTLETNGERPALKYGTLRNLETGSVQTFFTNRVGRAAFNALVPGQYEARLQDSETISYRFTVAETATAYVDLGVLEGERRND